MWSAIGEGMGYLFGYGNSIGRVSEDGDQRVALGAVRNDS